MSLATSVAALAYAVEEHRLLPAFIVFEQVVHSRGHKKKMRVFALSLCLLTATALAPPQRRLGQVTAQRSAAGEPAPQPCALDDARPRSAATLAALATAAAPLACYAAAPAWVEPVSNVLDPCFFIIQFIMLLRVIISWFPRPT